MRRTAGIAMLLVGLAYLALFVLGVVLLAGARSFDGLDAVWYLGLHAVGAAGGLIAGISLLRAHTASRTSLIAALAVVLASGLLAVLNPPLAPVYTVLAVCAALCAWVAWQAATNVGKPL